MRKVARRVLSSQKCAQIIEKAPSPHKDPSSQEDARYLNLWCHEVSSRGTPVKRCKKDRKSAESRAAFIFGIFEGRIDKLDTFLHCASQSGAPTEWAFMLMSCHVNLLSSKLKI